MYQDLYCTLDLACWADSSSFTMQGVTFVNQYIIMRTLGSGSFGKVKLCMNSQDQQLYAVKLINRQAMLRNSRLNRRPGSQMASPGEHVMKEIAVMRNLRHQNIVHLKEIIGMLDFFSRLGLCRSASPLILWPIAVIRLVCSLLPVLCSRCEGLS